MLRRLSVVVLCALAPFGVVTGCGSSGGSGKSSTTHTTITTPTVSLADKLRAGVVACRQQVAKSLFIPASERAVAESDCNGIITGHVGPLKAVILQACERAVAKVPVADRPPATVACKKLY